MNQNKLIFLLLLLVALVNYINYFQPDRQKLYAKINLLENKIEKAKRLNRKHIDPTALKIEALHYFFDQNTTYSQSMGRLQEMVNAAAKERCEVKYTKWAPVPTSHAWYAYLKLNISLECKPEGLIHFFNTLKKNKKLIVVENVQVVRVNQKDLLRFNATLKAYKVKKDDKK